MTGKNSVPNLAEDAGWNSFWEKTIADSEDQVTKDYFQALKEQMEAQYDEEVQAVRKAMESEDG